MANVTAARVSAGSDRPTLGIDWVLKWAAAACVLSATAVILLNFGYRLAAERALAQAANVGLRAATLPRATRASIEQSINHELAKCIRCTGDVSVAVQLAGKPIKGAIDQRAPGELSVTLSAPLAASLPCWLSALSPWSPNTLLVAKVDNTR